MLPNLYVIMKITLISDTHGKHQLLKLPKGDLLIHAGDISKLGRQVEFYGFLDWFSRQKFTYKVFIAGNHDFFFEQAHPKIIKQMIPSNVMYLNDSGCEIEGIKIWGSPITPWFHNWAFNRERGSQIRQHWDLIPDDTDILVTHGPPSGILDKTIYGEHTGCEELFRKVKQLKPKLHVFGHIHEDYGQDARADTVFINASVLDTNYDLVHKPIVVSLGKG